MEPKAPYPHINTAFDVFAARGIDSEGSSGEDSYITTGATGVIDGAESSDDFNVGPTASPIVHKIPSNTAGGGAGAGAGNDDGQPVQTDMKNEPARTDEKNRVDLSASRNGRYFAQQICRICGQEGHVKQNCPERKNLPCFLCGIRGHQSKDCPNQLCFVCGLPGHQARLCPNRGAASKLWPRDVRPHASSSASALSSSGPVEDHDAMDAVVAAEAEAEAKVLADWEPGVQKRGGVKGNKKRNKQKKEKFAPEQEAHLPPHMCYNCGAEGHIGRQCREPKVDATMRPSVGGGHGGRRKSESSAVSCFKCGRLGHLARDCAKQRRQSWQPAPRGFRSGSHGAVRVMPANEATSSRRRIEGTGGCSGAQKRTGSASDRLRGLARGEGGQSQQQQSVTVTLARSSGNHNRGGSRVSGDNSSGSYRPGSSHNDSKRKKRDKDKEQTQKTTSKRSKKRRSSGDDGARNGNGNNNRGDHKNKKRKRKSGGARAVGGGSDGGSDGGDGNTKQRGNKKSRQPRQTL